jgi:hypothetical protein
MDRDEDSPTRITFPIPGSSTDSDRYSPGRRRGSPQERSPGRRGPDRRKKWNMPEIADVEFNEESWGEKEKHFDVRRLFDLVKDPNTKRPKPVLR